MQKSIIVAAGAVVFITFSLGCFGSKNKKIEALTATSNANEQTVLALREHLDSMSAENGQLQAEVANLKAEIERLTPLAEKANEPFVVSASALVQMHNCLALLEGKNRGTLSARVKPDGRLECVIETP